jgi:hypothetical protein
MSLEDALRENTDAVRHLTTALQSLAANTPKSPEAAAVALKETKPPKSAPTTEKVAPSPSTATPAVALVPKAENSDIGAAGVEIAPPESTVAEVTYQQVVDVFLSVFKTDREKGLSALTAFGVKKAPELKPEQYTAFIAELQG